MDETISRKEKRTITKEQVLNADFEVAKNASEAFINLTRTYIENANSMAKTYGPEFARLGLNMALGVKIGHEPEAPSKLAVFGGFGPIEGLLRTITLMTKELSVTASAPDSEG